MRRGARRFSDLAALAMVALLALVVNTAATSTAQAADMSTFDAGNIISDAVFYDSLSMSASEVQSFLKVQGAGCTLGSDGSACLKDYKQTTTSRAADSFCSSYQGAANESAATIITKAAKACDINPRVLLVILQKEQGLVTGTHPSAGTYQKAMGFGCPDTAACDSQYYGFQNQVFSSARQYQRYRVNAANYSFRAGRTNTISYYPATLSAQNVNNVRCGTASVYIENQATAGLYNYTPYVPNKAALAAGSGTGDACSSYGNRNFYRYFTDWFGSTQSSGATAILNKYNDLGGTDSVLGQPVTGYICGLRASGCFQGYESGSIYYSPDTGAHFIRGVIGDRWAALKWETGTLGYPTSDEVCELTDGGCYQDFEFQSTRIYWSPDSGAYFVRGLIRTEYTALGAEESFLGYPTKNETCGLTRGGCLSTFQNGTIYFSTATGAHFVRGAIANAWAAGGAEKGPLGYPTSDEVCNLRGGGCYQKFQYQSTRIYWSPTTGAQFIRGAIRAYWSALGAQKSDLGYPTSNEMCGLAKGGCFQTFTGGSVYWSPATGAHAVSGEILKAWGKKGWETGTLGYPIADRKTTSTGVSQRFEGGTITYDQPTGKVTVS